MPRAPVLYVDHGSPMNAVEDSAMARALAGAAPRLPALTGIVVVSAHWEGGPMIEVTAAPAPATIHDFGGFPAPLYRIRYPAPGAPALAGDLVAALGAAGIPARTDPDRGLDHGAWVPLLRLAPAARTPVVQVSLPTSAGPAGVLALGRALAPMRDRGLLLLASGGIVHNLYRWGAPDPGGRDAAAGAAFEAWIFARLGDPDALVRDLPTAPGLADAVPTPEHFLPLCFALGARDPTDGLEVLAREPVGNALSEDVLLWGPKG